MIKCDKCRKVILKMEVHNRFIDRYGQVDLCSDCEKVETEWFEKRGGRE